MASPNRTTANGPLDGIRVLDCTQMMAGPFCTMLLADMGADVVKIEKPDGDDIRRFGPPFVNGESAAFLGINRNKRSIVIDLKQGAGADLLRRMAGQADVFVQNLRPGALDRLGLGYDDLREVNSSLIYCSISGFGMTGPYRDHPGFDLIAQGMSGLMSLTGHPDSPPAKVGVPITDLNAGASGAFGIVCALVSRQKTGKGQHVDTSLLETGIAYTIWESAMFFASGVAPKRLGSAHQLGAPYQAFSTSDGHITLGAPNQANWERLCKAIGRTDLIQDPRFGSNADRMKNVKELTRILEETFKANTMERWLDLLRDSGLPCGPISDMKEVYADPHIQAREMVVELEHPIAGLVRNIGVPTKLSETPATVRLPAPTLGQHTDKVLDSFGCSTQEIERLSETGVIRQGPGL